MSQAIARPTLKVVLHPGHCATAFARTQAIAKKVSGHLPQHHLKWKPDSRFPHSCHLPSGKRLLAGSSFKRNSKASFGSILAFLFSTRFSSFGRTRKPIAGATSRTSRFQVLVYTLVVLWRGQVKTSGGSPKIFDQCKDPGRTSRSPSNWPRQRLRSFKLQLRLDPVRGNPVGCWSNIKKGWSICPRYGLPSLRHQPAQPPVWSSCFWSPRGTNET